MFLEKLFGRLRRRNSHSNRQAGEVSPSIMPSIGTIMTTTSVLGNEATRTNSTRFFGRSNTVILDDGPASLQEVTVRKLDDDDEDGWLIAGDNSTDDEVTREPENRQSSVGGCPSSPGATTGLQPRRVDRARCAYF